MDKIRSPFIEQILSISGANQSIGISAKELICNLFNPQHLAAYAVMHPFAIFIDSTYRKIGSYILNATLPQMQQEIRRGILHEIQDYSLDFYRNKPPAVIMNEINFLTESKTTSYLLLAASLIIGCVLMVGFTKSKI